MGLAPGTKLGPYEVTSALGAGGMGEVYRARDTRLGRDVAVKILPKEMSADAARKQRFEREAKTISGLNHPNICVLHDVGSQDGVDYLVMECVEGETLAKRLEKGALPLEQVLKYGVQVADALDKAHRAGIVHRDLKPGNVMLTSSGAKLLDFGLARPVAPAATLATLTMASPVQSPITQEGTIVGTFQYMSPEQVEGKEVDGRSDIFSLGTLLYEMLTGKRAFEGKSQLSVASAILEKDPEPISVVKPLTPPALDHAIRKCLAKTPDERWQSASDLASELKWTSERGLNDGVALPLAHKRGSREKIAWTLAAIGTVGLAVLGSIHLREARSERVIRSVIAGEAGTSLILTGDYAGPVALSPDGSAVAFVALREHEAPLLWIRKLNSLQAHSLKGTDGASFPFWSPDSRSLGFFAGGRLKTVSAEGGSPSDVCSAPAPRGGTWSSNGMIVFAAQFLGGLSQVPATGGTPKPVTVLDATKHDSHRWPSFLPDGWHFLYLAVHHGNVWDQNTGVYLGSVDGKDDHLVMRGFTNAKYAAGRLLFARDNALMAQPFDVNHGVLQGEAERVADDLLVDGTTWRAGFDVSGSALLVYASGGPAESQAEWYDRSGKELGTTGEKVDFLNTVRLSPDGTRLASEFGGGNSEVWIYDLKRQVNTRLTFGPGSSSSPVWSPDGQWIAYNGVRGNLGLFRKPANGMGQEELLFEGTGAIRVVSDWSPDGKFLLFTVGDLISTGEIMLLPLTGDRKAVSFVRGAYVASSGRFSPDGRWVAYSSTETGRSEVYVVPFGGGAGKLQISSAGGRLPVWRRDGKELFYLSAENNSLMSVPIKLKPTGTEIGSSRALFHWSVPLGIWGLASPYDVTLDGQRFLAIVVGHQHVNPITLVTNWTEELKK